MAIGFGRLREIGITIPTYSTLKIERSKQLLYRKRYKGLTVSCRIIDLLKQLFWKQNRYAANNNAYAHKVNESRDASHDKTTPVNPTVPSPKNQHQAR
jgi:hypothetical protein